MKNLFIILFVGAFAVGCDSDYDKITGDFEVGYVNQKKNRNIYYLSQGIFKNQYVNSVGNNDDYIFVIANPLEEGEINIQVQNHYIISIKGYIEDPSQMESKGLLGPFSRQENEYKLDSLGIERIDYNITK